MDPIIIPTAVMAVSAIAQFYQAEKARHANQAELDKLKELFAQITPPDYDKSIDDPPDVHKAELSLPKYSAELQSPEYSKTALTPNVLRQVGQFAPDVGKYVQENAPQLLSQSADMKSGRDAQLRALDRYRQIGSGEFDPQYQAMVTKAQNAAQQQAHSASESVLQQAARRGVQNSGLALANQQRAGAQAMNMLGQTNLDAAAQAYQNRINALAAGAQLGSQIQGEDVNFQNRNADIINAFNQRMQSGMQNQENRRSALMNDAQARNLSEAQRIADQNAMTQNAYDQANRTRLDQLAQQGFQNRVGQQSRGDQIAQSDYNMKMQQLQYNNQLAQMLAEWARQSKMNQNNLKTQDFNNQIARISGQAAPMQQQIGMNTQHAQDYNNAIQGFFGNPATMIGQGMQAQRWQNDSNFNQANIAHMQKTGRFMTPDEAQQFRTTGSYTTPAPQGGHAVKDDYSSMWNGNPQTWNDNYRKSSDDEENYYG